MSNTTDKLAGKAKQAAGKLTDNKRLQAEGKGQEMAAKAREKVKQISDDMKRRNQNQRSDS